MTMTQCGKAFGPNRIVKPMRRVKDEWGELVWSSEEGKPKHYIERYGLIILIIIMFPSTWLFGGGLLIEDFIDYFFVLLLLSGFYTAMFVRDSIHLYSEGILMRNAIWKHLWKPYRFIFFDEIFQIIPDERDYSMTENLASKYHFICVGKPRGGENLPYFNLDQLVKVEGREVLDRTKSYKGEEWWLERYRENFLNTGQDSMVAGRKYLKFTPWEKSRRIRAIGILLSMLLIFAMVSPTLISGTLEDTCALYLALMVLLGAIWLCMEVLPVQYQQFQELELERLKRARQHGHQIPTEVVDLERELKIRKESEMPDELFKVHYLNQADVPCRKCGKRFVANVGVYPSQRKVTIFCPFCEQQQAIHIDGNRARELYQERFPDEKGYQRILQMGRDKGLEVVLAPKRLYEKGASSVSPADRRTIERRLMVKYRYLFIFTTIAIGGLFTHERWYQEEFQLPNHRMVYASTLIFLIGWNIHRIWRDEQFNGLCKRLVLNGEQNDCVLLAKKYQSLFGNDKKDKLDL